MLTHKLMTRRNALIASLIALILIGIGASLARPITTYYAHHSSGRQLSFQAYAPTRMLADESISGRSLIVIDQGGWYEKTVDMTLSKTTTLRQLERSDSYRPTCQFEATNAHCFTIETPNRTQVKAIISFVDSSGKATSSSDKVLTWTHDNTYFYLSITRSGMDEYPDKELAQVIDSFTPIDTSDLPVVQTVRSKG